MAKFVKEGKTLTYENTAETAIQAGTAVIVGDVFGIAEAPIPAGAIGALSIVGVFEFTVSGAVTQGAEVYFDVTTGKVTGTAASGLKKIGKAMSAAANAGDKVLVKLGGAVTEVYQPGETIEYTNGGGTDIDAGDVVVVGSTVAIAAEEIAQTKKGALFISGVFEFEASAAVNQGAVVYMNASTFKVTGTSASGLKAIGIALNAAAASGDKVNVKLVNPITTVA